MFSMLVGVCSYFVLALDTSMDWDVLLVLGLLGVVLYFAFAMMWTVSASWYTWLVIASIFLSNYTLGIVLSRSFSFNCAPVSYTHLTLPTKA